jgi:hypothetical protein
MPPIVSFMHAFICEMNATDGPTVTERSPKAGNNIKNTQHRNAHTDKRVEPTKRAQSNVLRCTVRTPLSRRRRLDCTDAVQTSNGGVETSR